MGIWSDLTARIRGSGMGINHRSMMQFVEFQQRRDYWQSNSIYLENVYNKIATDVATMRFKHVKITRNKDGADSWDWFEYSDLANAVGFSPNPLESPIVFWSNVMRRMLNEQRAVVVPVVKNGNLQSLYLANSANFEPDANGNMKAYVTIGLNNDEMIVDVANIWVFDNPKQNVSAQLGQISRLIDDNLRALSEKVNSGSKLKGFLKMPTTAIDGEMKKRAQERVNNIYETAQNGEIGYLQQGEDFKELSNEYGTASQEELEFLKSQLYNAFGINEKLFTADYNEDQYRAYHQSVLKVYQRVISEEINRKWFSKTARSQGQRLIVYYDIFDITSLKDLNEVAFKQVYSGNMNSNEVRTEFLGLPPYPEGETFESNKNAVRLGDTVAGKEDG